MVVKAVALATCVSCGRPIERWQERFTPLREGHLVVATEPSAMLTLHVRAPGACSACGGDVIEIRVEDAH